MAAGLALSSLSVVGAQIAMTRVLSLKYAANQTFLVVSFAVLGLALGAAAASRWCASARVAPGLPTAGMLAFGLGLALLTGMFFADLAPLRQIVLVPLPFFGFGVAIAAVFARRAARAALAYACDLGGAALGAFSATPLLDRIAAPEALFLFAATGAVAAALFELSAGTRKAPVTGAVLAGGALVLLASLVDRRGLEVPIHPDPIKDMVVLLAEAERSEPIAARRPFVQRSLWSAFGRTDLVNEVASSGKKTIFVDGAAGATMLPAVGEHVGPAREMFRAQYGPSLFLELLPPEAKRSAVAIGCGGGRDIASAKLAGVQRVVGVELNRDIVEIVRAEADFNGGIYDAPGVEIVVEEGRHFLRHRSERWDVVLLSIPVTKRAESYGGFALSESYLFTRESLGEYLDRLEPDGHVVVVCHSRQEIGRLVNCTLAAFGERGVDPRSAMERMAVFGTQFLTLVIAPEPRPAAFWGRLAQETQRLQQALPEERLYYVPGAAAVSPELAVVARGERASVAFPRQSDSAFEPDMSPVTDDRPFFYFYTASLPRLVGVVLLASGAVLLALLGLGLRAGAPGAPGAPGELLGWRLAVASIGVAFMLIEIAWIQRFIFWFGRPTLALGILLGILLAATGLGSLAAGRWVRGDLRRAWPCVALLGAVMALAFVPLQRLVFAHATGGFGDALARAAAITVPIGLLMGVAFPTILVAAHRRGVSVAWLWGVNGVGSVLGSGASVAVAMLYGYSVSMVLGGVLYVVAALFLLRLASRAASPSPG